MDKPFHPPKPLRRWPKFAVGLAIVVTCVPAFCVLVMLNELNTGPREAYIFRSAAEYAVKSGLVAAVFWLVAWVGQR